MADPNNEPGIERLRVPPESYAIVSAVVGVVNVFLRTITPVGVTTDKE